MSSLQSDDFPIVRGHNGVEQPISTSLSGVVGDVIMIGDDIKKHESGHLFLSSLNEAETIW